MLRRFSLAVFVVVFSSNVFADWALNSAESHLHFVSVKADALGELHHFTKISGTASADGTVTVEIDLSSVETNIPIRNERMREFLFQVADFPRATITSKVDVAKYGALNTGERVVESFPFSLALHGKSAGYQAMASVVKLADDQIVVSSVAPVIVSAESFGLVPGIDKLQSLAGLPSISKAVPVSFSLVFGL